MSTRSLTAVCTWLTVLLLLAAGVAFGVAGAQTPRFSNLQVIPEDVEPAQLLRLMKLMTRALGTTCQACHRSETGDFAADALPLKTKARAMMRMEAARQPGLSWTSPPAGLCVDCHAGRLSPSLAKGDGTQ